jgi:hypothetical protein
VIALLAAATAATEPAWPPFLPARESFPAAVVERVERVWQAPTLSRAVRGRPAAVPFSTYVAFIDLPDVTAAAARFLELAKHEVRMLDDDLYEADDHDGARGRYRVLVREPTRRVVLSWGEHRGRLLGTIKGSALTLLDFEQADDRVEQSLRASVLIENAVAARLARVLVAVFGGVADRKLAEGFAVTAKVAEWAVREPGQFCDWLAREPLASERRARARALLSRCRPESSGRGPGDVVPSTAPLHAAVPPRAQE